jgi:hypothetical protein
MARELDRKCSAYVTRTIAMIKLQRVHGLYKWWLMA